MNALTAAKRIERFVDKTDSALRADEAAGKIRVVTSHRLRVILRSCGFEKRGTANVRAIEAAMTDRQIFSQPPITTPGLDFDQPIHMSRTPDSTDPRPRLRFPVESGFERFLCDPANFEFLFPDLTFVKNQPALGQGARADILARKSDRDWVVIELKKGPPDGQLVHQVDQYVRLLQAWLDKRGKNERASALVIAGTRDREMERQLNALAAEGDYSVGWMTYSVELALDAVAVADL